MQYTYYQRCRQAEWWLRQNCKGNPLAVRAPTMGTLRQEMTRLRLLVDMPRHLRCPEAEVMAASAARTEGRR